MASDWLRDFPDSDVFSDLIRNIEDPEQIVRLASLRALVRVMAVEQPSSRGRVFQRFKSIIEPGEEGYVLSAGFLPQPSLLPTINRILSSSDDEDRQRARQLLTDVIRRVEFKRSTEPDPRSLDKVFRAIVGARDRGIRGQVPDETILRVSPDLASYLVTSQFATLALLDFDDRTETHAAESEHIGRQIEMLGKSFKPDVPALFQVYQTFFRRSMQFWLDWLRTRKEQGENIVREMPSWFPITEGPLAVSRQIEWAVSRNDLSRVVTGLSKELGSSDARDRWAAANLIEWSARYYSQPDSPRFGGGSGPPDVQLFLKSPTFRGIPGLDSPRVKLEKTEPQRYTDLTIFDGHLFPGDDSSSAVQIDESMPLLSGSLYTLEVAIRLKRTGIGAKVQPTHGVKNPRKDKETLPVYIVAESLLPSIRINEPFAKVDWPYNADSKGAYFRLEVKQTATPQGLIEVRIYDGSLDLLDIVRLSLSIALVPGTTNLPSASIQWMDNSEGVLDIAVQNPPRRLSIDVSLDPETSKYKFLFKFLVNDKDVAIPGSSRISSDDIDELLVKVRDFWSELVITNYSENLKVTGPTYAKYLAQLKDLGIQAWSLLFGTRYAAMKGASETIGELLTSLKPHEGAHIQITYSNADNFVFPWSIVYPPSSEEGVSPFEFWGARYQIEQVTNASKLVDLTDVPVKLVFTLDPGFPDSQSQRELLKSYQATSQGKLIVSDPISALDPFFQALVQAPAGHFYYFYCHGYSPAGKKMFSREGAKLLKARIEALPEDSAQRKAFETLLTLTAKMNDEPWIYIGNAEIKESKLKIQPFFNDKRPIVFLNMCQSADLLPTLSRGLVRVFLDHSACAVIGTESPMSGVFANAFSKTFFDELFAGEDVGTALWKARRHYLQDEMRNPLGLAYTLYGRALARLGTGPICARQAPVSE